MSRNHALDLKPVFRALADDTRLRILDELASREAQSLFEICARLIQRHGVNISRQGVSKHLAVLEEAGLVKVEWRGRVKLHTLNDGPLLMLKRKWLPRFTNPKESDS